MKTSLSIIGFFVVGILIGSKRCIPNFSITGFSAYVLYGLMFLVGVSMGMDKKSFRLLIKSSWKVFLVPLTVIVGSLIGSVVAATFISQISFLNAMSVGAGFGYYSLSSIMIGAVRGEELGTIALLSNLFREIFTLLFAPLLVWGFGKLAPIVSGGATAMDTTLPVITSFSGKEYAAISILSGTVLTLLVPIIESLFLAL